MDIAPYYRLVNDVARRLDASTLLNLIVDCSPGNVFNVAKGIDDLDVLRMVVDKNLLT